jgi:hypothetical protein
VLAKFDGEFASHSSKALDKKIDEHSHLER